MHTLDNRIVLWAPYGQHIPLKCRKCGTEGTTKNIDYIGARTVFVECDCRMRELEVVTPENADVLEQIEREKLAEAERVEKFVQARSHTLLELKNMFIGQDDVMQKIRDARAQERAVALEEYYKDRKL